MERTSRAIRYLLFIGRCETPLDDDDDEGGNEDDVGDNEAWLFILLEPADLRATFFLQLLELSGASEAALGNTRVGSMVLILWGVRLRKREHNLREVESMYDLLTLMPEPLERLR